MIAIAAALALSLVPAGSASVPAPAFEPAAEPQEDGIYDVRADDPEMNAAIARGRETLPSFYRRLASPEAGDSEFMIKFDIDPGEGVEYVWADRIERAPGRMTGILINQPVYTKDRMGDRVAIREDRVIDWGYRSGGVMQGSFTNRVLIGRMPPEEAEPYKEFLGW